MESSLSQEDRLQLQKMVSDSGATDQTDLIRNVKHSEQIRTQVKILQELKLKYSNLLKENKSEFEIIALEKCFFIFQHYTEIYNKVLKDEIDLSILEKFLDALKEIEDGKVNQHEASVNVGKYLPIGLVLKEIRHFIKCCYPHSHSSKRGMRSEFL